MLYLSRARAMWGATVISTLLVLPNVGTAQKLATPERFIGLAVGISKPTGGAETIEILVERWSTDAERDRLVGVLRKDGPAALLEEMIDLPRAGMLRTPDTLGYPIQFARKRPLPEGGEQITLITDRPILFWSARQLEYPFTLVELRIGADGKGEGRLSIAAKITYDERSGMISLVDYPTLPVHLTGVRREKN